MDSRPHEAEDPSGRWKVRRDVMLRAYAKLVATIHLLLAAVLVWLALRFLDVMRHTAAGVAVAIPTMLVLISPAIWFTIVGARVWRRTPEWASLLRWTHAIVLAFGLSQVGCGWMAIGAAERSAAHGGGLLGGFGYVQAGVGLGLAALALLSLP